MTYGVPVFIPSLGRATRQHVETGPLATLPQDYPYTYVVRPFEEEAYRKLGVNVTVLSEEVSNIGETRLWIGRIAQAWGLEKFVMLDDDLRFFTRIDEHGTKLRKSTQEDTLDMLRAVEGVLDSGCALAGISARQGNNHAGEGPRPLLAHNTRTNGATGVRTKEFLSVEHNRVKVMEDFDVSIQLLRAGHENATVFYWAYDQNQTNAVGGCSSYRTHAIQHESAVKLQELHGEKLVRLRQKQNKTGGEFGTRTEVTVYWKKAAAEGQAKLNGQQT